MASRSVQGLFVAALVLGVGLALNLTAHAAIEGYPASITDYDAREIAMLPRYCLYTQHFRDNVPGGNNQAEINRHYSILGPSFHNLHHYCWGLLKANRATILARNQRDRLFYLKQAIPEFDYVLRGAPKDFVLLPEILTKKGEVLIRLGNAAQGVLELQRAIDLKPDYWPPYAELSDYYKNIGELAKAREILDKALSFAPDSKSLNIRKSELDEAKKDKRKAAPAAKE